MSLYSTNFSQMDWWIVVVYLAVTALVGIWANRYVGNLSDYLVAGRTLRIRLAVATMTGTELGLVTMMYMAELGYSQQYASLYLAVLEGTALLAVGLTGVLVMRLRDTSVMTIPEFYERRYSRGVRILGAIVLVISGVLNMGLFLKAGSQFLTAIVGWESGDHALELKWVMTGLLLLVLFYTVLGGMVSVVITDLIQFLVLGVGMLIITGLVLMNVGWDGMLDVSREHAGYVNPFEAVNPSGMGSPIGWLTVVEMAIIIFSAATLWPPSAARTLSVKSGEVARQLYLYSSISLLSRRAIPILWGIGAFAFLAARPEMKADFDAAVAADQINQWSAMPLFLAKIVPSGLLGFVTAGMIAAFMSTHDSYLLCWSGVVAQDIAGPVFGPLSQRQGILITRVSILVIGAILLFWGLWYELSASLWNYMAITGTIYLAGALPVVAGGLYWPRGSTSGAYAALAGGAFAVCALGPILKVLTGVFPGLRSGHVTLLTFAVSALLYVVFSLLVPDREVHPGSSSASSGDRQ